MAALRYIERRERRIWAFVGREISIALAFEFVTRGQQIRAAEPQVETRREGVDVAGEIEDRSESRLAEQADTARPIQERAVHIRTVIAQLVTRAVVQSLREIQRAGKEVGFAAVVRVI